MRYPSPNWAIILCSYFSGLIGWGVYREGYGVDVLLYALKDYLLFIVVYVPSIIMAIIMRILMEKYAESINRKIIAMVLFSLIYFIMYESSIPYF